MVSTSFDNNDKVRPLNLSPRCNILLAGAAGFIGSHLVDRLLADGHRVIGVDNFITGHPDNLAHLDKNPRFQFIEHDITAPLELGSTPDWVMHFASPASPPKYLSLPLETLQANSRGTYELLELARRSNACFFLASTSEVYGDALQHPQAEGYWGNVNPVGPRSVYDESKRYAEALTIGYHRKFQQPIRIARIFNAYGARMDAYDGRVITNFVRQALQNEPLTVYGDGQQTRSLQHISDLVTAIVKLMKVNYQMPLNLGNPQEHKIIDLAHLTLKLTQSSSPIEFHALPQDDPRRRQPDITAARRLLGWQPCVCVTAGLPDVVAGLTSVLSPHRPRDTRSALPS